MSSDNLPVAMDNTEILKLMGVNQELQQADFAAAEQIAEERQYQGGKVDWAGKWRLPSSTLGQFQPIAPGEDKPKALVNQLTVIMLNPKFWASKSETTEVEKDGKTVQETKTLCESVSRIAPNTKGDDGQPVRMDTGIVSIPEFGLARTVETYKMEGSKFGDCTNCEFNDKERQDKCKMRGAITVLVIKHDGQDVDPYIAEVMANYTSTINFAKFMADARKENYGGDPTKIVTRIALQPNDKGVKTFFELAFTPLMRLDAVPPEAYEKIRNRAFGKFVQDRDKVLASKQSQQEQKQLEAAKEGPVGIGESAPF